MFFLRLFLTEKPRAASWKWTRRQLAFGLMSPKLEPLWKSLPREIVESLCSQKSPRLSSRNCSFQSGSSTHDVTVIALKSSGKNFHKEKIKASQKQWARGNRGRKSRVSGALPIYALDLLSRGVFIALSLLFAALLSGSWAAVTVPCRIACC